MTVYFLCVLKTGTNDNPAHGVGRVLAALKSGAVFAGWMLNQVIFHNVYPSLLSKLTLQLCG